MGFNRFGLGFGRRSGSGLPGFATTSAPVMSRSGATVNYTPGVYSPTPTGVLTTFYIDDVAQAPGSITFPYTLTAGSRMRATELPSRVGYAGASVPSNEVFYPTPTDIPDANWTYGENDAANDAIAAADSRKTLITTTIAPQAGKEWRAYRGPTAGGNIAQLGTPLVLNTGVYSWVSGGQNALGATVHCRIAETDIGGANPRWATTALAPYVSSNTPAAPVVIATSGAGLYDIAITLDTAADGRGRGVTSYEIQIGAGASWTTLAGGTALGLRTINTGSAADVAISVRAINANVSGGSLGVATTPVTVTPGVATSPISTTSLSSYGSGDFAGETFTFSASVPVGVYHGGEPFALSDTGFSITAMGTPSAIVGSTMAHGAMSNPYLGVSATQGFDELLASNTSQIIPYGLNIDPTPAGPFAIASNAEVTVVKTKRAAGATISSWQTIEKYLPFTVLPSSKAPQVGDFRPAMCSADKVSRLNINNLGFGCCRSLDLSGMGYPSVATLLARWRKAMPFMGRGGEYLRVLQVLTHVDATNYTAQYAASLIGDMGALFHSAATTGAERIQMAEALAPVAIDIAGQIDRGFVGGAGAGQHEFYHPVLMWAAALFNSAYMYAAAQSIRSNLDQAYWVEAIDVGRATAWPAGNEGGDFQYVLPFSSHELGKAVWGGADGGYPRKPTHGSQLNRTYSNFGGSGQARSDQWFPVMLILADRSMPSGPDMMKGGTGVPSNNTYSVNSHRSAMLHLIDRDLTIWPQGDSGVNSSTRAMYNAYRALISPAKLAQVPDTPYYSSFTAASNSITWNYTSAIAANAYSSTPITAQHIYISQDNIQFTKVAGVAANSSISAPGGIAHWCSLALENAQGEGRRSYTHKNVTADAAELGKVTPSGTPTGAVTCTTTPQLMVREYAEHPSVPWYVPITSVVPAGTPLFVGTGLWSGAISGAATTIVQREATLNANDWADIPGSTASTYIMVSADTSHRLRPGVTRNGVTVYGAPITVGALDSIPAGTIIDTDFGPAFQLYYGPFWTSVVAESTPGGTILHEPNRDWSPLTTSAGCIRIAKTTAYPRLGGVLTGLTIGLDYRVVADIPMEGDGVAWNANGNFKLGTTKLGQEYYAATASYNTTAGAQPTILSIDTTFTATSTNLWVHMNIGTATGGGIGGNPAISFLSVKEA